MQKRKPVTRALVYACMIIALLAVPVPAEASNFVVNSADDVDDGSCDASHCSLREAINAANTNSGRDSITFDIPGPGPHVIMLTDILTISDDQTFIDGSSQPGYSGSPVIILDGGGGGGTVCRGLRIVSNENTVAGLSFVNFRCYYLSAAIHIRAGKLGGGEGNLIENNYIGIDGSGIAATNDYGLRISSPRNTIRGNVISGNLWGIVAADEEQIIEGNHIGTDPTGMFQTSGGNYIGIHLQVGSNRTRIGGADPSEMNLISGNATGIEIESHQNEVLNRVGISVDGNGNHIGGPNPGEGNLISGNNRNALILDGRLNEVFGNMIGTDSSGMTSVPNDIGILLSGRDNVIGGSAPGEGNLISGNDRQGILFGFTVDSAANSRVIGNKIGTSIDGASPIGNGSGVSISWSSHGNVVGGLDPNEGNLIAFNTVHGIGFSFGAYKLLFRPCGQK